MGSGIVSGMGSQINAPKSYRARSLEARQKIEGKFQHGDGPYPLPRHDAVKNFRQIFRLASAGFSAWLVPDYSACIGHWRQYAILCAKRPAFACFCLFLPAYLWCPAQSSFFEYLP